MKPSFMVTLVLIAMIATVVGVDIAFFRHFLWERLMANVGIVLIFIAFYMRFFKR